MPVLVVCPICEDTTIAKNLNILDETIHKLWQLSAESMKDFFGDNATSKALATAGIQNKKDKQLETIKEIGYLKIMCKSCMTDFNIKQYNKIGMSCIRIGNMIFESEFFHKNRNMINQQQKEKPYLFKKTFWT